MTPITKESLTFDQVFDRYLTEGCYELSAGEMVEMRATRWHDDIANWIIRRFDREVERFCLCCSGSIHITSCGSSFNNWEDDYVDKLDEYQRLGVIEYWIVDYWRSAAEPIWVSRKCNHCLFTLPISGTDYLSKLF